MFKILIASFVSFVVSQQSTMMPNGASSVTSGTSMGGLTTPALGLPITAVPQPLFGIGNTTSYYGTCNPQNAYACSPYNLQIGACVSWYGVCGTDDAHCNGQSTWALACIKYMNYTMPITTPTTAAVPSTAVVTDAQGSILPPAQQQVKTNSGNQMMVGSGLIIALIFSLVSLF